MSRIGKMPIALPVGVEVNFANGVVTVKGPKGTLTREVVGNIGIEVEGATLLVLCAFEMWGNSRSLDLY